MSDLDTQLRDYLNTLVERTPAVRAQDIIETSPGPSHHRPRRRRQAAAITVALAITALVGAVVLVRASSSNSPAVSTGPSLKTSTYDDRGNGISLTLSSGWRAQRPQRAPTPLQVLVEVRSPDRFPAGLATRCLPSSAHGVSGARLWIGLSEERYPTGPQPARPREFTPQKGGPFDPALVEFGPITTLPGCPSPPTAILFDFTDHQRKFQFEIVAGPDAPSTRLTQAYRILDSLHVATPHQLHRAPSPIVVTPTVLNPNIASPSPHAVRVDVVNASGRPGADTTLAVQLRGLGYTIAGTQTGPPPAAGPGYINAAGHSLSITACRVGFSERGAGTLADAAFGPSGVTEDASLEAFFQAHNSDCLVVIGQDNAANPGQ